MLCRLNKLKRKLKKCRKQPSVVNYSKNIDFFFFFLNTNCNQFFSILFLLNITLYHCNWPRTALCGVIYKMTSLIFCTSSVYNVRLGIRTGRKKTLSRRSYIIKLNLYWIQMEGMTDIFLLFPQVCPRRRNPIERYIFGCQ